MNSSIKILGNSGAIINIVHSDILNKLILEKTVQSQNKERFLQQIKKQKSFTHLEIKTPEVYEVVENSQIITVKMAYVAARDFVTYTNLALKNEYVKTIDTITDFVLNEFRASTLQPFPKKTWLQKVEDVLSKIQTKHNKQIANHIVNHVTKDLPDQILIGECHGDLTFSNMMVDKHNQIHFIDFLDPPIETPYEDVAKFLQDADIFWSLLKYQGICDVAKIKIYWKYASKKMMAKLADHINLPTLRKIQALSLLRIVPYVDDPFVVDFLFQTIEDKICC